VTVDDALILEIVVELGEGPEIADRMFHCKILVISNFQKDSDNPNQMSHCHLSPFPTFEFIVCDDVRI